MAQAQFHLEIVTPEGVQLSEDIDELTAPSVDGQFGVLPGHRPMIAALATGDPAARPADLVAWLDALVRSLDIPPLSTYGFGPADVEGIIPKVLASSSMKGNPIPLTAGELRAALEQAM